MLRTLRAAGVHTFAVVQPMLPGDVHALADAIAASCDAASLDVLRGEEGATADFDDTRYTFSRDARWQSERLDALRDALLARARRGAVRRRATERLERSRVGCPPRRRMSRTCLR